MGKVFLKCNDGCGEIQIDRLDDMYFLSYNIPAFYAYQNRWKNRIEMIWSILTGKEYTLYEVAVSKEEYQKFKELVAEL